MSYPLRAKRLSPWGLRLLIAGLWLYVLLVVLSPLSTRIELAVHFALHVLIFAVVLSVFVGRFASRGTLFWAVAPTLYLLLLVRPWGLLIPGLEPLEPLAQPPVSTTITSWNLLYKNFDQAEIRKVLESHPSDIVILIEIGPRHFEVMPWIRELYPHGLALAGWRGDGIAVLSKRDDIKCEPIELHDPRLPAIAVTLSDQASGREVKFVAMHTASPIPSSRAIPRDLQLAAFRTWAADQTSPLCLIGDLNTTPWTHGFVALEAAGFHDSRQAGFGNCASWPAQLGIFGIPIDHALSRGSCRFTKRELGPVTSGSDHRPLFLELSY